MFIVIHQVQVRLTWRCGDAPRVGPRAAACAGHLRGRQQLRDNRPGHGCPGPLRHSARSHSGRSGGVDGARQRHEAAPPPADPLATWGSEVEYTQLDIGEVEAEAEIDHFVSRCDCVLHLGACESNSHLPCCAASWTLRLADRPAWDDRPWTGRSRPGWLAARWSRGWLVRSAWRVCQLHLRAGRNRWPGRSRGNRHHSLIPREFSDRFGLTTGPHPPDSVSTYEIPTIYQGHL